MEKKKPAATHTPAPWRAEFHRRDTSIGISGGGQLLATVVTKDHDTRLRDALLMKAAPKLLEASKAALAALPPTKANDPTIALLKMAIEEAEVQA